MRITFILPPVNMSGGIRVVAIYARELAHRGHNVHLVSAKPTSAPLLRRVKDFIRGRRAVGAPTGASHLDHGHFDHVVVGHSGAIRNDDVPDADVVIATWWETAEWVAALHPKKGAKVYFIQHHEVFSYLPVVRCRATYKLPLHKIVVARWLKELMASEYSDSAVDLVPNAVDHAQFYADTRGKQPRPTVGFLYSRVPFKGVDVTLAALSRLHALVPGLRIVTFGSDSAGSDQLPEGTEFFLSPPQDFIREIYSQCDVWVTASTTEGFNLPAMEAMACRTPVVSTKAGWPAEAIVNHSNGYLVDVNDVDGLAERIKTVLQFSEEEWRQMSARAYATVEASCWEASAEMFEAALERARMRSLQATLVTEEMRGA